MLAHAALSIPTARAVPLAMSGVFRPGAPAHRPPLARLARELDALGRRVASLAQGGSDDNPAWRDALGRLQVHLFLTASQLLPMWRDMSHDRRPVDAADERLARLAALVDAALVAGAMARFAADRRALLVALLQKHQLHSMALLRALDAVAEPDGLRALAEVWTVEGRRLRQARREGQPVVMDNEDADPVGGPPR